MESCFKISQGWFILAARITKSKNKLKMHSDALVKLADNNGLALKLLKNYMILVISGATITNKQI